VSIQVPEIIANIFCQEIKIMSVLKYKYDFRISKSISVVWMSFWDSEWCSVSHSFSVKSWSHILSLAIFSDCDTLLHGRQHTFLQAWCVEEECIFFQFLSISVCVYIYMRTYRFVCVFVLS